jgi:sulfide:quinone oxidoreductase
MATKILKVWRTANKLRNRAGLFDVMNVHRQTFIGFKRDLHLSQRCDKAARKKYDVLVVGAGAGGLAVASHKLGNARVAVVDEAQHHYYQPLWTLVGGGVRKFEESKRSMKSLIPSGVEWIPENAATFDPDRNTVATNKGTVVEYDYLVVATGLQLRYEAVDGLVEALEKNQKVCSNYSPVHVHKTLPCIENFKEGNALFTFPSSPIKCAGAPQKIMYLTEWRFKQMGKRERADIKYITALPVTFGVKKYSDALNLVCDERGLERIYLHHLVKVDPGGCKATFESVKEPGKCITMDFDMLHVTPPMGPTDVVKQATKLVDDAGFVKVNKETLQHVDYPNVFALGDCSSVPTSKTAAAAAAQSGILSRNLVKVMAGGSPEEAYDGYTSCPLTTGYDELILAEFDFNLNPLETFPFNQAKPRRSMFLVKKDLLPPIYWNLMIGRGWWEGPAFFRRLFNPIRPK